MEDERNELIALLARKVLDLDDDRVGEIVRDAENEAVAEAREIIKDALVRAILQRALQEIECRRDETTMPRSEEAAGAAQNENATDAPEADGLREEIEAIRGKLAENEAGVNRLKACSGESGDGKKQSEAEEAQDPEEATDEGCGYYVYGVTKRNGHQAIEDMSLEGIDPGHGPHAVEFEDIQAVASDVPLCEFGQKALAKNTEDLEWVTSKVLAHQAVLEKVMTSGPLVPFRFCTIYRTQSRVREMLSQNYDQFSDCLAHLDGKQEWAVKGYYDHEILAAAVGETSGRVRELEAQAVGKSGGAAYFGKKKAEDAADDEVERVIDECVQRTHDCVAGHAEQAVISRPQKKEVTGRAEEMVFNGVYLVAGERMPDFRAELDALKRDYGSLGFTYETTGPWPPYNFVKLDLEQNTSSLSPAGRGLA